MIQPTIRLMVLTSADNPDEQRLVRAPLTVHGHYVTVEDYYTGEKLHVHVADLTEPKR